MRVLIALVALVTAPFLASVAQEPPGNSPCWTVEHGAARDIHSQGQGHHWAWGHAKHECAPPVGGGGDGGGTGGGGATGTIAGTVYSDLNRDGFQFNEPGLVGWGIEVCLNDCLNGPVLATATSGPLGAYTVNMLPGTYLVCQVQPAVTLTEPVTPRPCPGGFGNTAPVSAGMTTLGNNFGFAP